MPIDSKQALQLLSVQTSLEGLEVPAARVLTRPGPIAAASITNTQGRGPERPCSKALETK